jgi:hypothetical protein
MTKMVGAWRRALRSRLDDANLDIIRERLETANVKRAGLDFYGTN